VKAESRKNLPASVLARLLKGFCETLPHDEPM
jgi:hypothetical protein